MLAEHHIRAILGGKCNGWGARILLQLLGIFSIPYKAVLRIRILAYKYGLLYTKKLPKPVISVGNITVGGTGKTPTVAFIARYFLERGRRVAVLSRGYGRVSRSGPGIVSDGLKLLMSPDEAGDEPYMLAEKNPGLMVVVGCDRYAAGLHALEKLKPDVFILDDGFQHLRLHRDLDILLMDSNRPLGNGRVLPAGLLREPVSAATRADIIIYTRCVDEKKLDYFPGIPYCSAAHAIERIIPASGGEPEPLTSLSALRGVAFAGIAEPDSFFSILENAGLDIRAKIRFPDHCRYGENEIAKIISMSNSVDADYLITTEKDSVKLSDFRKSLGRVYSSVLELKMRDVHCLTEKLEKLL